MTVVVFTSWARDGGLNCANALNEDLVIGARALTIIAHNERRIAHITGVRELAYFAVGNAGLALLGSFLEVLAINAVSSGLRLLSIRVDGTDGVDGFFLILILQAVAPSVNGKTRLALIASPVVDALGAVIRTGEALISIFVVVLIAGARWHLRFLSDALTIDDHAIALTLRPATVSFEDVEIGSALGALCFFCAFEAVLLAPDAPGPISVPGLTFFAGKALLAVPAELVVFALAHAVNQIESPAEALAARTVIVASFAAVGARNALAISVLPEAHGALLSSPDAGARVDVYVVIIIVLIIVVLN